MMRKEPTAMIRSVEATGKNIEEAFAKAMEELGIDDDMLNVEKVVLENPRIWLPRDWELSCKGTCQLQSKPSRQG
jgi:hypothetical protein